jgi:TRAP-type C4-dicarboxylate transport system permease small subunit
MRPIWRAIERVLAAGAVLALFALVALPFTQVVMRDAFARPIVGLEEATRWGLIALVYLALPLLVAKNEQIRFDELVNRLPRRARTALERAHLLAAALVLGVLVNAALQSALQHASTRTPILNIPFLIFIAPMVIGLAAMALAALGFALRRPPPPVEVPNATLFEPDVDQRAGLAER